MIKRITSVVPDLLAIIDDPSSEEDEKRMAAFTIVDAIAPDWHPGAMIRYGDDDESDTLAERNRALRRSELESSRQFSHLNKEIDRLT